MSEGTRLYGVNLDDLAEVLGSGDAAHLDELRREFADRIAAGERDLLPGTISEALRTWIFEPPAQVPDTAPGAALASAFEILVADGARRAGVPSRLAGSLVIPSIATMADDVEVIDVELDFDRLESRLSSRKTCGVVFQPASPRIGHLAYREARRVQAALRTLGKERLASLPFFGALLPPLKLAVRHELDLVAISSS